MKANKLTQAAVAKRLGYNEATVSRYLAGNYTGDVKAFESVVEEVLAAEARRQSWENFYVETEGCTLTSAMLELTREACDVGLVTGAAGLGKTTACNRYATSNKSAILITLAEGSGDNWTIIRRLFEAMETRAWTRKSGDLTRGEFVMERLKNSGRLIIVDNAQRATLSGLRWLLDLHDYAGVPVALIGNPDVLARLDGSDQLSSRIGLRKDIGTTSDDWIDAAADALVAAMWSKVPEEVKLLARETARGTGHLRRLVKQLRITIKLCESPAWSGKAAKAFIEARALVGAVEE